MNFEKSLMHCSTIAYFMQPGNERTPRQLWEDACEHRDEWATKYANVKPHLLERATGLKAKANLDKFTAKVAELEPFKDEEPLSQTAKSYLKKYYAYLKYGKWSASLDKGNKYTNKGKLGEPDSILLCSFLDDRPYIKNTERFDDEYLTGEPDVIRFDGEDPYIIDVKTSWDIETFMDALGEDLTPLYWWQLQGYFALTGAKSGEVSYCLVDTPEAVMNGEKYALSRRLNGATDENPEYKSVEAILVNNMTFSDMPHADRRIRFIVERDDEAIEKIYKRVAKCREYLQEVQDLHAIGTFAAREIEELVDSEETM